MREADAFFHALRFMTILPLPRSEQLEQDWLPQASRYFPAVGIVVGLASGLVLIAAAQVWVGFVPAILAIAASALLTGALHEDGLADTADGFGGGRSRETRLAIMKDSRIGAYGALALLFTVSLRLVSLAQLAPLVAMATLVAAHASARAATVLAMNVLPYAGDTAATRIAYSEASLGRTGAMVAAAFTVLALAPVILLSPSDAIHGVVLAAALALVMAIAARRLIGGYNGDVLGAVEQVAELGFLLGVAAR